MSTHKHIDKICVVALALTLLITILFMNGAALGVNAADRAMGYENRLFDTSRVHTIDIVMDDWDSFIATCENEEYVGCAVVIDGESYKNVGIRAKGNTSLSQVSAMNSDRYSFKIEFDQYDKTKNYHGLDKLCLNNLIQDTTYMKDYLTYQMMGAFGADEPLCSYVNITVNGENWGLYLAVEGVEESFLQRNYGSNYGNLYKPDRSGFGGGRGSGRNFNFEDFAKENGWDMENLPFGNENFQNQGGSFNGRAQPTEGFDPSVMFGGNMPEGFDPSAIFGGDNDFRDRPGGMAGGFGGMSSSDVLLQYTDDNPDSYASIFENAKTPVSSADQNRLIESLKKLSNGEDLESVVDIDEVLRYFVVHNFVVNGDSYTGSMVHNYYLYEENGQLSMIPWDYNLAFGTFQGNNAKSAVNDPIDTPLSVDGSGNRPMADWIFSSEEYTELYHQYFAEFLSSTDFAAMIDTTADLIAPYVEEDATKFYSYEAFETGVAALRKFCLLRAESIQKQLDGAIPSTDEGQSADSTALIDASDLNLSDMGSMNMGGMGFGMGGNRGGRTSRSAEEQPDVDTLAVTVSQQRNMLTLLAENTQPRDLSELPDGGADRRDMQQRPGGGRTDGEISQGPGGGRTDGEMPQRPGGDFANGETPQRPGGAPMDGETPQRPGGAPMDGETPQMPSGGPTNGEIPQRSDNGSVDGGMSQMPNGGSADGETPQMPDGGSANDETPQMPGGGFTDGEMPQMPNEDFMRGGNGRGENQFMQRGQTQNGAQGNAAGTSSSAISQNDLIMVGVSVLFLLAGLLFAFKVKH